MIALTLRKYRTMESAGKELREELGHRHPFVLRFQTGCGGDTNNGHPALFVECLLRSKPRVRVGGSGSAGPNLANFIAHHVQKGETLKKNVVSMYGLDPAAAPTPAQAPTMSYPHRQMSNPASFKRKRTTDDAPVAEPAQEEECPPTYSGCMFFDDRVHRINGFRANVNTESIFTHKYEIVADTSRVTCNYCRNPMRLWQAMFWT